MKWHVHGPECNRTATITWRLAGKRKPAWRVAAFCRDNERTLRAHFKRFAPKGAEFVSVRFTIHKRSRDAS